MKEWTLRPKKGAKNTLRAARCRKSSCTDLRQEDHRKTETTKRTEVVERNLFDFSKDLMSSGFLGSTMMIFDNFISIVFYLFLVGGPVYCKKAFRASISGFHENNGQKELHNKEGTTVFSRNGFKFLKSGCMDSKGSRYHFFSRIIKTLLKNVQIGPYFSIFLL